jgi:predicted methyltransferase
MRPLFPLLIILALASCREESQEDPFPKADRPVSPIVADAYSTEDARDRMGEFDRVIELAGVKPGMWVADVGAGRGYYSVRLSPVVGKKAVCSPRISSPKSATISPGECSASGSTMSP